MTNKVEAVELLLHEELVDILCVAEHWMHDNNKDTYNIEGYTLGSCFARKTHKHGGVGIFVRENMIYTEIREIAEISIEKECEMCGLHLPQLNIIVVTVYRSPNTNTTTLSIKLMEMFTILESRFAPQSRIIVTGDFNIDTSKNTAESLELISTMASFDLRKLIEESQESHHPHILRSTIYL